MLPCPQETPEVPTHSLAHPHWLPVLHCKQTGSGPGLTWGWHRVSLAGGSLAAGPRPTVQPSCWHNDPPSAKANTTHPWAFTTLVGARPHKLLFTLFQLCSSPRTFIFSQLFLPKSSESIPFSTSDFFPKHPMVRLMQSQNSLLQHPITHSTSRQQVHGLEGDVELLLLAYHDECHMWTLGLSLS